MSQTFEKPKKVITDSSLRPGQERAINQLYDWWNSSERFATLEGPAGSGKTFILKYFIQEVVDKVYTITAPTHKALKVVEKTLNRKGQTLQKLHGLRPNIDVINFDIENPLFSPIGDPSIKNYNLIIIDEASMVNKDLHKLNMQAANLFGVKILYVGDQLQLPPVNEECSPVFKEVKTKIVLTEIVRQEEGNPLLALFSKLRYDIQTNGDTFLKQIIKDRKCISNGTGYNVLNDIDFKQLLVEGFTDKKFIGDKEKGISANTDFLRCTSYTNMSVSKWNKVIRNNFMYFQNTQTIDLTKAHNNPPKNILDYDDLLTSYNTIVDRHNNPIIVNSEDYIINTIKEYTNDWGLKTFAVNLQAMDETSPTPVFFIIDHNDMTFYKYRKILDTLHERARKDKTLWKAYYGFKNKHISLKSCKLPTSGKTVKKDIDYGYALTIHKLQGSTFDNIYIDLADIVYGYKGYSRFERDIQTRNRLLYVAASRARNKAIFKF